MSIIDKLASLNLEDNATLTLTYREGTDVFVHNESDVETALDETDVVSTFSSLIATPGLKAYTPYGDNVLETLRDADYLDDYGRDGTFEEYLTETINNNFYDVDLINHSTEKYDYKRGYCTLTATVSVPVDNFIKTAPSVGGWNISIKTPAGTLTLD